MFYKVCLEIKEAKTENREEILETIIESLDMRKGYVKMEKFRVFSVISLLFLPKSFIKRFLFF